MENKIVTIKMDDGAEIPLNLRYAGKGPAILFIHGWLTSGEVWSKVMNPLSGKYTVIALDLPGFGLSPAIPHKKVTIKYYTKIIGAFGRQYFPDRKPFAIVAHSLGAIIALELLKAKSIFSRRLLLSGPPINGLPAVFYLLAAKGLITRFLGTTKSLSDRFFKMIIHFFADIFVRKGRHTNYVLVRESLMVDPVTAELLFNELLHPRFRDDELSKQDISAMVVRGERDRIVPRRSATKLSRILNAEYYEISKSRHTPMLNHASKYLKALNILLAQR